MRASIAQPRGRTSACENVRAFAGRNAELPLHEIDAVDELGDRVLDLQPRVHLEKIVALRRARA